MMTCQHSANAAAAAATDPAPHEQQNSSMHLSVQPNVRTAMASSSLGRRGPRNAQAVLLMARELLRSRSANAGYHAWLGHITELIVATREALAPSHSFRPPPSRAGDVAHGAPLLPS